MSLLSKTHLDPSVAKSHPLDTSCVFLKPTHLSHKQSGQRVLQLKNIVFHERVLQGSGLQRFFAGLAGSDAGDMLEG